VARAPGGPNLTEAHQRRLTGHLQVNKHDFATRRGLLQMVGKRRRLLRYIAKRDGDNYLALIQRRHPAAKSARLGSLEARGYQLITHYKN